jgi:ABC-type oligopeptide transport system substrate-binding subunit
VQEALTKRLSLSVAILVIGVALLVAAELAQSAGVSTTAEAPRGGTLRISSIIDVDSVDPAMGYGLTSGLISDASCVKLFRYASATDGTSARVVPNAVQRVSVSQDGRTYTFDLKRTLHFHTGARVTAQRYADALDRVANPRLGSPGTPFVRDIVGASAVIGGTARSLSGVRVLTPYRLQIRLTAPAADLTARLTLGFFCPVLPDTPVDSPVADPAASGPYHVAERVVNQRIVLERNPFYRGDPPARFDRIVWTIGGTLQECQRAVEEDRADWCSDPGAPRDAWRGLAEKYGINRSGGQLFVSPLVGTWYYAFNHSRPAFSGPGQIALKKAINFAIDRPALARPLGYLMGKRTDQMLPPPLGRKGGIYPLGGSNLAAARRLYAKARIRPTKLVLYSWNTPPAVVQASVLAFDLRQLGIDLDVKYYDAEDLFERARTPGEPFDILLGGWVADYPDPWGFFGALLDPQTGPLAAVVDPRVRRQMEAVNRLTGDARLRAWADLDVDLMRNDPPWAPFVHHNARFLVSPSLGCFTRTPIFGMDITALCRKR